MDYLQWKASYARNPATPKAYKVWVDRFNAFTGKRPTRITLEDVSEFREAMIGKYAPKNIQYGMAIIHDYVKFQMAHGLNFPLALFKVKKERANSHYTITEKEYKRMLNNIQPNSLQELRNHVVVRILWETGVRVGELTRIQLRGLIPRGCQILNEKNVYTRNVYWSQETDDLLRFYLKKRRAMKTELTEVFISCNQKVCKPLNSRQVERLIREICGKHRMNKRIVPHSFRHAFVHRHILRGISEPVVANMVGHSSTNTIMNYSRLSSRELAGAWGVLPPLSRARVRGSVRRG